MCKYSKTMPSLFFFVLCSKCLGLKKCDIRKTHVAVRFTLHLALKTIYPANYLYFAKENSHLGSGSVLLFMLLAIE